MTTPEVTGSARPRKLVASRPVPRLAQAKRERNGGARIRGRRVRVCRVAIGKARQTPLHSGLTAPKPFRMPGRYRLAMHGAVLAVVLVTVVLESLG